MTTLQTLAASDAMLAALRAVLDEGLSSATLDQVRAAVSLATTGQDTRQWLTAKAWATAHNVPISTVWAALRQGKIACQITGEHQYRHEYRVDPDSADAWLQNDHNPRLKARHERREYAARKTT
jgi:hypothetical protein